MRSNETAFEKARLPSKLIPDEIFTYLILLWPILWLLICPFGLWANGLVIRTFLRMGLNDSVSISFFCLGLSDFAHVLFPLVLIVAHVLEFMEAKFEFSFKVPSRLISVHTSSFTSNFNNLTMYITTFLALQRCLCIVKPLHFKEMFTKKKTWGIIGCFVIPSFLSTVYLFSFSSAELTNPFTNTSHYVITISPWFIHFQTYVGLPVFTIFPIIGQALVFGSVIVMTYGLKASIQFKKDSSAINASHHNNSASDKIKSVNQKNDLMQNSKERTAIIQVVLLSTIFLVTNVPKIMLALVAVLVPNFGYDLAYGNIFRVILEIRLSCDYLNSAVNFFVYYKYNSRFRKVCFATQHKLGRHNDSSILN